MKNSASRRTRILLVDDDLLVAQSEKQILERLGYAVSAYTDSPEALAVFGRAPRDFDLVITDQVMPKMTGTRLALEILRLRPDTPIILTTAYADSVEETEAIALGIRAFIRKPFSVKDLSELISRTLELESGPAVGPQ